VTEVEAGVFAARLLVLSALVFLGPGLGCLAACRVPAEWPERVVLAFSLSYSWIFVMSVVVPLCGWTVDHAALATVLLVAGLVIAVARRQWRHDTSMPAGRPELATLVVVAVVIVAGVGGWVIESPFTGEEALDFASLSRFADGGPVTFDNTSLLPDTHPVYLFQPYQLALGMVTRWSGADPLIAFVKFRSFLAPLCLLCLYALLRRFTATRVEAVAAFLVVVLCIALEIETWERNSLFPFVRRQGFSAGALVPTLFLLCIIATRRVRDRGDRLVRRVALAVAPVMLVASVSTHAMEVVTFLSFAAAATATTVVGLDRGGDRKLAMAMVVALAVAAGAYLSVHSVGVSYMSERSTSRRVALGEQLGQLVADDDKSFAWASLSGDNIFVGSTPLTTAAVVGVPALSVAALRAPAAAAVLALGTVPLALMHATPAGSIVLRWLVAPGTMRDSTPYFMFTGMLGVALGLVALAQGILAATVSSRWWLRRAVVGSLVLWFVVIGGRAVVPWLGHYAVTRPDWFLLVQAASAAIALAIAAMHKRPILASAPFTPGVVILTVCLAIPLGVPGLVFGGAFEREANASMLTRFEAARSQPSTLDWPMYYEELARTIRPSLPVPRAVVDELRRRIPPRQVLLAHPSYSCGLVVLIDAYCINPEFIYGDYFRPAERYHAEFVEHAPGLDPEHAFFNTRRSLTDEEDRLLTEYHVSYLLADPDHADVIALKLRDASVDATVEMELDGYRLYSIGGS